MGKRSILKRFSRIATKIGKATEKKALSWENSFAASMNNLAGEQHVKELSSLNFEEVVKAQQEARSRYFKITAAALPHKITQFKREFSYFQQRLSQPGEITVGEFAVFVGALIAGYIVYRGGEIIGRADVFGYKYEHLSK
ncbi:hypothetical protein FDP41_012283 [Naegleria fowleri]|uniref:Uncharacterized protein n=1 Tax=Naegleria fowleri TaxID=5763 RepID=A0A6A5C1T0_NAEFO|nr:uncharacterized protein FDP41_012283 [Naegleria fowleri]KAF0981626.1 hypothetical protein FDP41_012283 [Naegleria fowleri]CAG4716907.1 unnamed protein product [Naegleria fowleri]